MQNPTKETALRLLEHGLALLAIGRAIKGDRNTGKRPARGGLSLPITDPREARIWGDIIPLGIAIVCSRVGGMVCLDIDSDADRHPEAEAWRLAHHDEMVRSGAIVERTGGGGWHYWWMHPGRAETVASGNLCKGVSLLADGGKEGLGHYAVIAPSMHYKNTCYEWDSLSLMDALDAGIVGTWPASAPWAALAKADARTQGLVITEQRTATPEVVQACCDKIRRLPPTAVSSRHHSMLAWVLEAVALGVADDTVETEASNWLLAAGRGTGEQPSEVSDAIAEAHNRLNAGTGISVSARMVPESVFDEPPADAIATIDPGTEIAHHDDSDMRLTPVPANDNAWMGALTKNPVTGLPKPTTRNAMTALIGCNINVGWNDFVNDMRWRSAPPWEPARVIPPDGEQVTDPDLAQLQVFLSDALLVDIPKDKVYDALVAYAKQHSYHPVKNYLEGVTWDGTPRLDTMASRYFGTDDDISDLLMRCWMLSAIARIYTPGCLANYMIVIEGPQGSFKTTALMTLGGRFYGEITSSIDGNGLRDAVDGLIGKWIAEIPELDLFKKTDITRMKAFLTRTVDRVRLAYGRRTCDYPRQCVLAGTTNDATYLHDPTGARRIWPIRIVRIRIKELQRDRDQLWAEALARYRMGDDWHIADENKEVHDKVADAQEARQVVDAWDNEIFNYLNHGMGKHLPAITYRDVWATILEQKSIGDLGRVEQLRIRECMTRMKWADGRCRINGNQVRAFIRPGATV